MVPAPPDRPSRVARADHEPAELPSHLHPGFSSWNNSGLTRSLWEAVLELLPRAGLAKLLIFHPMGIHPLLGHQIRAPGSVGGVMKSRPRRWIAAQALCKSSAPPRPRGILAAPSSSFKPELPSLGPPEALLGSGRAGQPRSVLPSPPERPRRGKVSAGLGLGLENPQGRFFHG